jgi:hypothetical protein
MKTCVYFPNDNAEHFAVLEAFLTGIRSIGEDAELRSVNDYVPSDIAVVFGVGKKNVPCSYARGKVIEEQKRNGKSTIVLEKGYVRRDSYYAAGWNGLNNRANFRNAGMPSDRWNALDIRLKPWSRHGDKILVIGQVPSDASVQNVDIIEWCAKTILELSQKVQGRQIVFRPHPLARSRTPDMLHAKTSTRSLAEDLDDALFVVTYNSNVGVDAILEGVPVFVADRGAMAYDVASKRLEQAFMPAMPVVSQWAHNLAYAQWSLDEMREGKPWAHLTRTEQQVIAQ